MMEGLRPTELLYKQYKCSKIGKDDLDSNVQHRKECCSRKIAKL